MRNCKMVKNQIKNLILICVFFFWKNYFDLNEKILIILEINFLIILNLILFLDSSFTIGYSNLNNSMMNIIPVNNLNSSQISVNNNNSNFKFDLSKFKIGGDNNTTNKNSSSTMNTNYNMNSSPIPAYSNNPDLLDEKSNFMIPDSKNLRIIKNFNFSLFY